MSSHCLAACPHSQRARLQPDFRVSAKTGENVSAALGALCSPVRDGRSIRNLNWCVTISTQIRTAWDSLYRKKQDYP
jgi:hypothetical protein